MPRTIRSEGLLALGRAIAEIRAAQGMTQKQFGAHIGWDDSVIAKIELGIRRLDVVELVLLARAMNADAAELLRKVEEATP